MLMLIIVGFAFLSAYSASAALPKGFGYSLLACLISVAVVCAATAGGALVIWNVNPYGSGADAGAYITAAAKQAPGGVAVALFFVWRYRRKFHPKTTFATG
ncbi:hypothetical protein EOS93_25165 [Rhizobium sp. RMa-01]|uniref:hypothetical protein n=1 Tax=unclassified Rhizobium TaxID=2613769 RepID=UPI000FE0F54D|nr:MULTISPECIES: hypothetical protein [unclassified Rhizobium]RVU08346.1 hypothetical protein EOS93_25165 [Rhizobium sp. RMa-01]